MTGSSTPEFRLGIVTGLQFEADIVRRRPSQAGSDFWAVTCLEPGPDRAARAAQTLIDDGAKGLLSFGVAGGCNPALLPSTAIVATGIRDLGTGGETRYTNRDWQRRLKSMLLGNVLSATAQIATTPSPLTKSRDKRALFEDIGVAAVDMESTAVAGAAIAASVPFMALRVVVDRGWRRVLSHSPWIILRSADAARATANQPIIPESDARRGGLRSAPAKRQCQSGPFKDGPSRSCRPS